jgi:hypothetical protein
MTSGTDPLLTEKELSAWLGVSSLICNACGPTALGHFMFSSVPGASVIAGPMWRLG